MENNIDFDALSKKAFETNAMEDLNELFGAVFGLENWEFIARGEFPNFNPYVASHPDTADNQPMIRAFTDSARLQRFAKENNLTQEDGSCVSLTIPIDGVVEYLEQFIAHGVHGIWFNSDMESEGFFIPLKQLRPIKEHLAKLKNEVTAEIKTLIVQIKDGLGFPSGFVKEADYTCHIFCRVPADWIEGEQLKPEHLEKIYAQFYGANWRMGNSDGSHYVVRDSYTKILPPEMTKPIQWSGTVNDEKNHYWWYLASADGTIKSVKEEVFGADINSAIQTAEKALAQERQNNLADFGMTEMPDGGFEQNLTINQVGAVNFDTSIAPFYEAIVPLLENYQGLGEYITLLAFDPNGKSDLVENIAENSHGAYLQISRFLYLNPKNNVRIGVNSVHSNQLRHIQSNSELLVSFELCKNLDNQTAAFYFAFLGAGSEVKKLINVIQPILANCGYEAVS